MDKSLYIFVEGLDDKRFLSNFMKGCNILILEYASEKKEKTESYIKSINSMPHADYLFFADSDGKTVDETKIYIKNVYGSIDTEKIVVVQYEIESWYYAGLSQEDHERLKLKKYEYNTNSLTKEMFNAKLPKLAERVYYMQEILRCYNIREARQRNNTVNLFFERIQ